ncbi:MAG: arylsulfatase [Planctomycetes bacterium B3_Pla]|nr:MAG: arylsulfatase [Planctomycetes bacterium B3_Pla]
MSEYTRRHFLRVVGIGTTALMMPRLMKASDDRGRPDILIIIGDDIGYSDFGCYGGEIPTPNIDRIAANGIRFTQFHTESMCAPTRVALLTGQYHIRGYKNGRNVTIAEALSRTGYRNCAVGKWHNAGEPILNRKAPLERGFDNFFGTPQGCGSFFAPLTLSREGEPAEDEWKKNGDFYYTDAISDTAVRYIKETPNEVPLFLYTAYTAAHWPLHALTEDIEKQRSRYAMGWDELRRQRFRRMKELGVIKPDTPLSTRHPNVPAWEDERHKEWQQRRMEVYAAQIARMDKGIGRIIDALEQTGRLRNTLMMVLVDNGGCHVEYKQSREGSFLNKQTRDGRPIKKGNLPDVMPGPEDTWQSYGYGWANASNTPFRMFKQYEHEGGICVPLIVQWPGVIRKSGRITGQVCHVMDILPTVLEAAGVEYPKTNDGRQIDPADGKSMVPILRGQKRQGHDVLFWKYSHGCAVRQGKWKLVRIDKQPWELYDIESDPVELVDLARTHPERTAQLAALWEKWHASSTGKKSGDKKKKK